MSDRVLLASPTAHVVHVKLNRPDKRNGLDLPMFDALIAAGEQLRSDHSVRAIVLSGEGPAFCAGLDWKAFLSSGTEALSLLERDESSPANRAQKVAHVWQEVPVPVIAAVHGAVFGGGLQIALAADIRYAHPTTELSVMEIRYGLIPDMSITQTLTRLVRPDVAKELMFTGRNVPAQEALALGLVTKIDEDPLGRALELAATIATKSPHAIRAGKQLLNQSEYLNTKEALVLETELQKTLLGSRNQMEAVQSVFEKRIAVYEDVAPSGGSSPSH